VLANGDLKPLSQKSEREKVTLLALLESAPGNSMTSATGTLWGALNVVTYYADHVRTGRDRLDSAWFGRGAGLKEKAWEKAIKLIG